MNRSIHTLGTITDTPLNEIIAQLESGVSVNADDDPAIDGQPGVLKVSCVSGGVFYPEQNKRVHEAEQSRATLSVKAGNLLVTRANTFDLIASCGIVDRDYPNLFLPDKVWRVVLKDTARDSLLWLNQVLNSPDVRVALKARASGTSGSMKNISQDAFLGIHVHRPPLAEQKAIAAVLSAWDRAIEQTTALIAAKERLKQGLMQQLLTGKRRFKGWKGEWRKCHIGDLLAEVRRYVSVEDDTEYRLVSVRRNSGGMFDRAPRPGREIGYSKLMTVETGDFLIARRQVIHGAMTIVRKRFHGAYVSNAYATLVPKPGCQLHMPFLDILSRTPRMYYSAFRCSYGVAIEKMVFHLEWFLKEQILLPATIDEQKRIADVFGALDSEIRELERRVAVLRTQKRGLMQQLLTGKVRVPKSLLKKGAAT